MTNNLAGFISENMFLIVAAIALVAFIVYAESKRAMRKYADIGTAEAVKLLNREDPLILDVRESNELSAGTIRGAKQIASSVIAERLAELEPYKAKPILAFCANGLKAGRVCQTLTKNGFTNVYHLKGGLTAWIQANLPLTK